MISLDSPTIKFPRELKMCPELKGICQNWCFEVIVRCGWQLRISCLTFWPTRLLLFASWAWKGAGLLPGSECSPRNVLSLHCLSWEEELRSRK